MKLFICDHPLFAESLALFARDRGHEVVGTVATTIATATGVLDARPDVCIVSVDSDTDVQGLVALVGELRSAADVLVIAGRDEAYLRPAVLAAGAAAFVCKSTPAGQLMDVVEGRANPDQPATTPDLRPGRSGPDRCFLTGREMQVLERLCEGDSTTLLATHLGVGHATARSHVQSVLMKLGVHSRCAAVAAAIARGLVDPLTEVRRSA